MISKLIKQLLLLVNIVILFHICFFIINLKDNFITRSVPSFPFVNSINSNIVSKTYIQSFLNSLKLDI